MRESDPTRSAEIELRHAQSMETLLRGITDDLNTRSQAVPSGEGVEEEGEDALPSDGGWGEGDQHGSSECGLTDGDSLSASEGEVALGDKSSGIFNSSFPSVS